MVYSHRKESLLNWFNSTVNILHFLFATIAVYIDKTVNLVHKKIYLETEFTGETQKYYSELERMHISHLNRLNGHNKLLLSEKKSLETQIDNIQDELNKALKMIKAKDIEVDSLNLKNTKLETMVSECSDKIKKLESVAAQLTDYENKFQSLSELNGSSEIKINDLTSENDQLNNLNSVYATDATKLNSQIEELKNSISSQNDQINSKQSANDDLRKTLNETTNALESLETQHATINTEKNSLVTKVIELNRTIDEQRKQFETKQNDLQQKQKQIMEIAGKLSSIEYEKQSLQDVCEKAKSEAENHQQLYQMVLKDKEDIKTKNDGLEVRFKQLKSKLEQSHSEKQEISTKHADEVCHMKADYENQLDVASATIAAHIEENKNLLQQKNHQVEKFREENEKHRDEVNQIHAKHMDEITRLNDHEKLLLSEKELLTTQIDSIQDELNKSIKMIETKDDELKSLSLKKIELETIMSECNDKLETIAAQLAEYENKFKSLSELNGFLEIKINDLTGENDQLNNLNSVYATDVAKLNSEIEELKNSWKKERDSLLQDTKIYRAKLMKEREAVEQKKKEYEDTHNKYDEKLEKMKEKMKTLYKEKMSNVREKNEKELNDLSIENRRIAEKVTQYEVRFEEFSKAMHDANLERLQMLKEHEIMKSKLRSYEIESQLSGHGMGNAMAPKFIDGIHGTNFNLEDEESDFFDNRYLDQLKSSPAFGRESFTLDENNRRNSMVPPHIEHFRSSYMPQYVNLPEEPKNQFVRPLDDRSSTQRSLHERPRPPVPRKNGDRLFQGGFTELPRRDALRDQNDNVQTSMKTIAAKKSTRGKRHMIFTSTLKEPTENL